MKANTGTAFQPLRLAAICMMGVTAHSAIAQPCIGVRAYYDLCALRAANGGNGSEGFLMSSQSSGGGVFGWSMASALDFDGDGVHEIVIGDPGSYYWFLDEGGGVVEMVFGRATNDFPAEIVLGLPNPASHRSGSSHPAPTTRTRGSAPPSPRSGMSTTTGAPTSSCRPRPTAARSTRISTTHRARAARS